MRLSCLPSTGGLQPSIAVLSTSYRWLPTLTLSCLPSTDALQPTVASNPFVFPCFPRSVSGKPQSMSHPISQVCAHVCFYLYTHIYIYMYIYTYIYMPDKGRDESLPSLCFVARKSLNKAQKGTNPEMRLKGVSGIAMTIHLSSACKTQSKCSRIHLPCPAFSRALSAEPAGLALSLPEMAPKQSAKRHRPRNSSSAHQTRSTVVPRLRRQLISSKPLRFTRLACLPPQNLPIISSRLA